MAVKTFKDLDPIPVGADIADYSILVDDNTNADAGSSSGKAPATFFKGDKGDTGAAGAQGEQGIQGIQGIQGEKGDTGDQGIQGVKGDPGEWGPIPVTTGTAVSWLKDQIYGSFSSPTTGNITQSLTGAENGVTVLLYHTGGAEPSYPAEWHKLKSSLAYSTTSVNLIYAQHIAGRVAFTITQES